jgi:hypothetical protein
MKIISSYNVQIVGMNKIFKETVGIYRNALSFLIEVFDKEWSNIQAVSEPKSRFTLIQVGGSAMLQAQA